MMSTRATYKFETATIYIHYDGYFSGAAAYFYSWLTNPSKGCNATQFIRANEHAELTHSHGSHGDTEYQYDIAGNGVESELVARSRNWSNDQWHTKYVGCVREFIDSNHELIEEYQPFKRVTWYGYERWLTLSLANTLVNGDGLEGQLQTLRVWQKNGRDTGANWSHAIKSLRAVIDAFPELETDEIRKLISE